MKLVDILARELKAWPSGCEGFATQDPDKEIRFEKPLHDFYAKRLAQDADSDFGSEDGSKVTRADWQAAKDKLEGKTVKKPNANKDGWIRHRGGKCPVEAGTLVDVRLRSGVILYCTEASNIYWSRVETPDQGDVMAYKIYDSSEQPEIAEEPSPVEPVAPIAGPLQWRDRITEIDAESKAENERHSAAMTALDSERAVLVLKLASEGLAMIERKADTVEDMSDPAKWRKGDLLECVHCPSPSYTAGKLYSFLHLSVGDGSARTIDNDGVENGLMPHQFKWHSRPTN